MPSSLTVNGDSFGQLDVDVMAEGGVQESSLDIDVHGLDSELQAERDDDAHCSQLRDGSEGVVEVEHV